MKRPIFVIAVSLFAVAAFQPGFSQNAPEVATDAAVEEPDLSHLSEETRAVFAELKAAIQDLNENGETAEKLEKIGDLYLDIGDAQRAIVVYSKEIEQYGGSEELFLKFARVLAISGSPELAMKSLNIGLEAFPNSETLLFELGKAYLAQGKAYAAISSLKAALEINPRQEQYRYFLATAYRVQKKMAEAVEIVDGLIEEKTELLPVYLLKGDLLLADGELSEGVLFLEELLKLHPDSNDVKALLVRAYQLNAYSESDAGNASGAIRSMRSSLEFDPFNAESMVGLASYLHEAGEFEEAETLIKASSEKHPNFLEVYVIYGKMLESRSRPDDARAVYEKGLAKSRELGRKAAENNFLSLLGRK